MNITKLKNSNFTPLYIAIAKTQIFFDRFRKILLTIFIDYNRNMGSTFLHFWYWDQKNNFVINSSLIISLRLDISFFFKSLGSINTWISLNIDNVWSLSIESDLSFDLFFFTDLIIL